MNRTALERLLRWLASLALGVAPTPEYLNADFSIEQPRTQNALLALTQGLDEALAPGPDGMVAKLFEQWRRFFGESINYTEAFGGRKLDPLKTWARKAGIEVRDAAEAERFFFALHTYFALLVKLLAWLAISRHLAVRLGAPAFGELLTADGETLRRRLRDMESGGIFRAYGISNLLEGDFFAWYLYAWNPSIEDAVRALLARLDEYEPNTLRVVPEETRDLFKMLYHKLLPREVRHNLGEYYTPDWLAQRLLMQMDGEFFNDKQQPSDVRLRQKLLRTRWLDPACGPATFPVLVIGRMREVADRLMVPPAHVLEAVLSNVVGFDLNPLAVMTARVNYLLQIADLLDYRKGDVAIPIYLADSVRMPALGKELESADTYEFRTAVSRFLVPAPLCTKERFDRFCEMLEESVRSDVASEGFVRTVETKLRLASNEWNEQAAGKLRDLYDNMAGLHRSGLNGLWARLLKNNFAHGSSEGPTDALPGSMFGVAPEREGPVHIR